MIQIYDVQVVLLAKTLAVSFDNLLGSYSVRGKADKGQKVLYRQADKKKVSSSLQKLDKQQLMPECKQESVNVEHFKGDQSVDSGVYEEIEAIYAIIRKKSQLENTPTQSLVEEGEKTEEIKLATKSLSRNKFTEDTNSTFKFSKIVRSATMPRKIGRGVKNLSLQLEQIEEQESQFKCDSCPKTFKTSNKLKMHMMCHTSFSCNTCDKGFRFASLLKNHMNKGCEDEKQYKEDLKSQSLNFQSQLKRLSLNNAYVGSLGSLV